MSLTIQEAHTRVFCAARRAIVRQHALVVALRRGDGRNADYRNLGRITRSVCKATPHLGARRTVFADLLILAAVTAALMVRGRGRHKVPLHIAMVGIMCIGVMATQRRLASQRGPKRKATA